jgi:hypothetical protein
MPSHDAQREPTGPISRRAVLQGAAAAGAAGLAVSALGATMSPAAAAAASPAGAFPAGTRSASAGDRAMKAPGGPIVVHVRNAKTGDIELFAGTAQTRLRDRDLAARIAQAFGGK